jgi:hypothetical protein
MKTSVRRIYFSDAGFDALLTLMSRLGTGSPSLTVEKLIFQAMKAEEAQDARHGKRPRRR